MKKGKKAKRNVARSAVQVEETPQWTATEEHNQDPAHWVIMTGETPSTLSQRWSSCHDRIDALVFYQDGKGHPWREFSNWYLEKHWSFDFWLPLRLLDIAGVTEEEQANFAPMVPCDNSEKAIMLCKAAVMGDLEMYNRIAAAESPKAAKMLGRRVALDAGRWGDVVCGVAVAVLRQKFFSSSHLRNVLLSTGDKILCEATARDKTWAIGVSIKMPEIYQFPHRWSGCNVLGWSLMQVRSVLAAEEKQNQEMSSEWGAQVAGRIK